MPKPSGLREAGSQTREQGVYRFEGIDRERSESSVAF